MAAVATLALIHGGGGSAWDWHLDAPTLREHGHDAVDAKAAVSGFAGFAPGNAA